ncbi:MAG: hypothetical protein KFW21_03910 [Spirochaetota bacterium]|nr:hypothetical protein [Spirochaetota bacterium]
MKKFSIILLLLVTACSPKKIDQTPVQQIILELDRPRMEVIIKLMPNILRKSEEFKQQANTSKVTTVEYNRKFYQYLFEDQDFAMKLNDAGFKDTLDYENFYTIMIEMYVLLLKQPEVLDTAVVSIPSYNKEVTSLLLKKAQEPNNQRLVETLNKLQYELTVYKNLVLVNAFMGELNSLNKKDDK